MASYINYEDAKTNAKKLLVEYQPESIKITRIKNYLSDSPIKGIAPDVMVYNITSNGDKREFFTTIIVEPEFICKIETLLNELREKYNRKGIETIEGNSRRWLPIQVKFFNEDSGNCRKYYITNGINKRLYCLVNDKISGVHVVKCSMDGEPEYEILNELIELVDNKWRTVKW